MVCVCGLCVCLFVCLCVWREYLFPTQSLALPIESAGLFYSANVDRGPLLYTLFDESFCALLLIMWESPSSDC